MKLFDQVMRAVNDPQKQASAGQIGQVLQVVNQLSNQQSLDASTTQALLSVVGSHVRTALSRQRAEKTQAEAESLVDRFSGTQANLNAVRSIFTPQEETETVQDAAQQTGLNAQKIQSLLPLVVPLVLQFLQLGTDQQAGAGQNSILAGFLDTDNDGDADMGDAISMAGRFLKNL